MADINWFVEDVVGKFHKKAEPKPAFLLKPCFHCGEKAPVPDTSSWRAIKHVPWCEKDFKELYAALPPQFTPQDFVDTFLKVRPNSFGRADGLEVELGLKPPCPCNNCKGAA